jgi:ribosomal protein S18 acetylase RimI-like enzyme
MWGGSSRLDGYAARRPIGTRHVRTFRDTGAMTIERATTAGAWAAAQVLIREYAASLGVSLTFQDFDDEIANLPREYGPPHGAMLLAREEDGYVACGALRRFSHDACEMKRLYVRPAAQRRGIGRAIAAALIDDGRRLGYRRMLLDTLPSMRDAQALYRSIGFRDTEPYRHNPIAGTTFMELRFEDGRDQTTPGTPTRPAPPR